MNIARHQIIHWLSTLLMLSTARSFVLRPHRRLHFSTAASSSAYDHDRIEKKWQTFWSDQNSFKAIRRKGKEKKFVLDMFPYPSGSGLHVGHPEGYTATDIMARYWRMNDFDVLHPMGWDAFGLPAEQYAIQTGIPPAQTTAKNIATFKRQLTSLGFSVDWDREIATTDENYFKWTQWLFLRLFKAGYAEQSSVPVNWCAGLGSVLANEEIIGGVSERGGYPVERLPLRQWVMKITKMADELEDGLDELDWPQGTLAAQKSWIGRSTGAEVSFECGNEQINVFTTRPDTILGVTYVVLSPESPLVSKLVTPNHIEAVNAYVQESATMSDMSRMQADMTGVYTGAEAIHPLTGERVPVWVARHVLGSYGTGAMMAVPSTDKKDLAFAELFDIALSPQTSTNIMDLAKQEVSYDGADEIEAALSLIENRKVGSRSIQYKLRDWVFSRQRYWGEPIPIYFPVTMSDSDADPRKGDPHHIDFETPIAVPDEELPLCLPEMDDITPGDDPAGCLAKCVDWRYFQKEGKWYARETNTMPQWAGSCWYYLRFTDPTNENAPWSLQGDRDWMPVDLYVGGSEHAVLHLLYARFWHKVFYSLGLTTTKEPFTKLVHQGMILGSDGEKMSKSRGNVVNPDDIVSEFGADALRLYEMFMGPLEAVKPWQTNQITGVVRFRNRVYALATSIDDKTPIDEDTQKLLHKTMKKVTIDIEKMSFNTAISSLMILSNHLVSLANPPREAVEKLVLMLSPLAPHLCEECWSLMGHKEALATRTSWVQWNEELCIDDSVNIAIQVNGKTRGVVQVEGSASEDQVREAALRELPKVQKALAAKPIKKSIYVSGKILNLIV